MARILVTYYSRTGNTEEMAKHVAEGVEAAGVECEVKPVTDVEPGSLIGYDGFVIGSPVYYGMPAAEIFSLFDESVILHGRLAGRAIGAFSSSGNVGGGNETTCMAILQMGLVHGMVAVGTAQGDHYGPVSVKSPDDRARTQCVAQGKRVAELVLKIRG